MLENIGKIAPAPKLLKEMLPRSGSRSLLVKAGQQICQALVEVRDSVGRSSFEIRQNTFRFERQKSRPAIAPPQDPYFAEFHIKSPRLAPCCALGAEDPSKSTTNCAIPTRLISATRSIDIQGRFSGVGPSPVQRYLASAGVDEPAKIIRPFVRK